MEEIMEEIKNTIESLQEILELLKNNEISEDVAKELVELF